MTVYAISEPNGTLVKIGHAADIRARFRSLFLSSPVPIVLRAHWTGGPATERSLHQHFADRRQHGEWFDFASADPVKLISEALGRLPEPPLSEEALTSSRLRRPQPRVAAAPVELQPPYLEHREDGRRVVVVETLCRQPTDPPGCACIEWVHRSPVKIVHVLSPKQFTSVFGAAAARAVLGDIDL